MSNPLLTLLELGQSPWLDNLSRPLVTEGELAKLIASDGISGITSNPAIFHKAISGSDAYDEQIRSLSPDLSAQQAYEALAIRDIRSAADVLRPVFDRSNGTDGFVSLEVNPHLAGDTQGTIEEAARLWREVDRENVLIKIPGTPEGLPAIEETLANGISVNVTLLFSLEAYRDVMQVHLRALERRRDAGQPLAQVASVASFFLSRIDTKIDPMLDALADAGTHATACRELRGRAAVASARLAYAMWKETYTGNRWETLREAGGRVQKPLWASTSTKDKTYSDVKYVEPLIGPHTINTLPDETVAAFRDHGTAEVTVENDLDLEQKRLDGLADVGIDLGQVTRELVAEGVEKFNQPFDALLAGLEEKRSLLASG